MEAYAKPVADDGQFQRETVDPTDPLPALKLLTPNSTPGFVVEDAALLLEDEVDRYEPADVTTPPMKVWPGEVVTAFDIPVEDLTRDWTPEPQPRAQPNRAARRAFRARIRKALERQHRRI